MTVALCLVLVAPARLRPSAAVLGGAFAAAQGYGVLVLGWHYPSDVAAACTIAAGWLALSVAALGAVGDQPRTAGASGRPVVWPAALATVFAGGLAAGAVLAHPEYVRENTTLVAAAIGLGLAALGLVVFTAAALTRVERGPTRPDGGAPALHA
jgi:hypothetical protein